MYKVRVWDRQGWVWVCKLNEKNEWHDCTFDTKEEAEECLARMLDLEWYKSGEVYDCEAKAFC